MIMLPDPEDQPTVGLWPTAANALGIGRTAAYRGAKSGEIPTIRIGRAIRVSTAELRRMLGLDVRVRFLGDYVEVDRSGDPAVADDLIDMVHEGLRRKFGDPDPPQSE